MKLYVIGLGPGAGKDMTIRAQETLALCQCVVGYKASVSLLEADNVDKEMIKFDMDQSVDSCHTALQKTIEGKITALVSAGDSTVYGITSILYQVAKEYPTVDIEIIPGVTAASSGSALLGAPLSDDFVVISLSEEGTNWEIIERRLMAAVEGGFVLCLYNPASADNQAAIRKACRILLWKRKPSTVCGYVKSPGLWGEKVVTLTLEQLFECSDIDMFTTVFIGNDQTESVYDKMLTTRGFSAVEALSLNQDLNT